MKKIYITCIIQNFILRRFPDTTFELKNNFFETNIFLMFLESQLLSNYIDVSDSLPHSRAVQLFRPYIRCLLIVLDVIYGFVTQHLIRKPFHIPLFLGGEGLNSKQQYRIERPNRCTNNGYMAARAKLPVSDRVSL